MMLVNNVMQALMKIALSVIHLIIGYHLDNPQKPVYHHVRMDSILITLHKLDKRAIMPAKHDMGTASIPV